MTDLVQIQNNRVVVSSLQIAEHFDKEHKNVLRLLSSLLSSANKQRLSKHFFKSNYKDETGKNNTMYLMDRDGFSLLAMGFTGDKALKWKLDFIDAFNAMEQEIQHKEYQASLAKSSENALLRKKVEQLKKDKFDISIQVDLAIRERRNLETELEIQEKVINNIKKAYIEKFEKDKNNITNTEMDEWNKMRLAQLEVYIKSVIEAVKIRGSIGMKDIQRINKFVDDLI